jgi:hypothetical protein
MDSPKVTEMDLYWPMVKPTKMEKRIAKYLVRPKQMVIVKD